MIAGFWNFFSGWAALVRKEYFDSAGLLYHNLQAWGWVWLIIGAIQVLVSVLLFARRPTGRYAGIFLAGASMLVWFLAIAAYPLWAVLVIAIDAIILYALCAHGREFE